MKIPGERKQESLPTISLFKKCDELSLSVLKGLGNQHRKKSCRPLCTCVCSALQVHRNFQARTLELIAISYSRDLPNPGIELASPVSPASQRDSLPPEPSGKPSPADTLLSVQPCISPNTLSNLIYIPCNREEFAEPFIAAFSGYSSYLLLK